MLIAGITDQYTPDKCYGHFVDRFVRDQDAAGRVCRGVFFLKGFSECIIEIVSSFPDMSFVRIAPLTSKKCDSSSLLLVKMHSLVFYL